MLHATDCYTNFTPNHTFSLQQEVTPVLMPVICTSHRAGAAQPSPCPHPRRASHAPLAPCAPKALTSPAVPTTCLRSGERARARATPHGHPAPPPQPPCRRATARSRLDRLRPAAPFTSKQVPVVAWSLLQSPSLGEGTSTFSRPAGRACHFPHALGARLRPATLLTTRATAPALSTHASWKP